MEWAVAVATFAAALVAAVLSFAGGYYGARWQANNNLEQWQREQLVQFCADLMAAGHEGDDYTSAKIAGGNPAYPAEAVSRMRHAFACIALVNQGLAGVAHEYRIAVLNEVIAAAPGNPGVLTAEQQASAKTGGIFLAAANKVLVGTTEPLSKWDRVYVRVFIAWNRLRRIFDLTNSK